MSELYLPCIHCRLLVRQYNCIDAAVKLLQGRHKTEKTSLAAWNYFLSKNKYTVCRSVSIYTKHTKNISSCIQCKNTKTWSQLIPEKGYQPFFFFFLNHWASCSPNEQKQKGSTLFTSNFHCQSKLSSTAFFHKDQTWLFRLCTQEFPFLSAPHGNEGRCRRVGSVGRIHTGKRDFKKTFY